MGDPHANGQHDREDSRGESTLDLIIGGGGSRHYDPPSDPADKAEYDSGWNNAERK